MRIDRFPGDPGQSGFRHGRAIRELLTPTFREGYLDAIAEVIAFDRDDLRVQADAWLAGLPPHFQTEVEGMGSGAGVTTLETAEFLFADIARPSGTAQRETPTGPMCSALVSGCTRGSVWVARNCDWITPTLLRGTSAVVHEIPGRIPMMSLGIRGDIDADTGINAEGLWLHIHTMHARDTCRADELVYSWLFWAREALETCASIDELESFARSTQRDQGLLAICVHAPSGQGAVLECTRTTTLRHDIDPDAPRCITNHPPSKPVPPRRPARPDSAGVSSGPISRYHAMHDHLGTQGHALVAPNDFMGILSTDGVEMRTPRWIRTIYSAVAEPATGSVWFCSGLSDGTPAASRARWSLVRTPWT